MDADERKRLIESRLNDLLMKIKAGSPLAYLIITDKSSGKYLQCTISRDHEKIIIDVPESMLSDEEIKRIKNIIRDITGEETALSLQIQASIKDAVEIIDRIFINGLGASENFDVDTNILE